MYEHAKLCIVIKMVRVFLTKLTTSLSFDFRIKRNNNISKCRYAFKFICEQLFLLTHDRHRMSSKILILTFVPILDTHCQLWAMIKVSNLLYLHSATVYSLHSGFRSPSLPSTEGDNEEELTGVSNLFQFSLQQAPQKIVLTNQGSDGTIFTGERSPTPGHKRLLINKYIFFILMLF